MDKYTDFDYLIQAASWQDSLLQSYRSLHLTFQSILLAIGIGLLIAIISFEFGIQTFIATTVLLAIWMLQVYIARRMRIIVLNRGEDVNFWHRAIILAEQELPSQQRFFTNFKIHQQARRKDATHLQEMFLSDKKIDAAQADILIEKGLGHTRRVVDEQLFKAISWLWLLLILGSGVFVAYKFAGLWHLI